MKVKTLRKKLKRIITSNGIEMPEEEFDQSLQTYLDSYSRFKLVGGNAVKYLRKQEI